ncbi:hypothetical protein [Sphingomonas sp.]|uniref:hypothetical protein n=1 Tax=Sphingomonas sp. TaxID=28214 RepID=UPI00307D92C0
MSSLEDADVGSALVASLPKTAVQALYHAVTGKTENLSKWLNGNVVITFNDVRSLYGMLLEELQHHNLLAKETCTIVVTDSDDKKVTYSSWERFELLQAQSSKITSDISIKLEFVVTLPNTAAPQRCIVNVTLDSSLPVINSHRNENMGDPPLGFLMWMANDWRTVNVSIDFVDYLLAKKFVSHVDEWFKSLEKTPCSPWNNVLLKSSKTITQVNSQVGRIGCATFIASYLLFTDSVPSAATLLWVASMSLLVWSFVFIGIGQVNSSIRKRAARGIMPTVIIINGIDERTYKSILEDTKSVAGTISRMIGSIVMALILNVASSYIFYRLNG